MAEVDSRGSTCSHGDGNSREGEARESGTGARRQRKGQGALEALKSGADFALSPEMHSMAKQMIGKTEGRIKTVERTIALAWTIHE
jgi:hypothetical protein